MKKFLLPALLAATVLTTAVHAMGERPASTNPAVGQAGTMPPPPPHGGPGGFGEKMFDKADANKDGFLTKAEIMSSIEKRVDEKFAKWDTNKDGRLSREEMAKGRDAMRARMLQRWEQKPQ